MITSSSSSLSSSTISAVCTLVSDSLLTVGAMLPLSKGPVAACPLVSDSLLMVKAMLPLSKGPVAACTLVSDSFLTVGAKLSLSKGPAAVCCSSFRGFTAGVCVTKSVGSCRLGRLMYEEYAVEFKGDEDDADAADDGFVVKNAPLVLCGLVMKG